MDERLEFYCVTREWVELASRFYADYYGEGGSSFWVEWDGESSEIVLFRGGRRLGAFYKHTPKSLLFKSYPYIKFTLLGRRFGIPLIFEERYRHAPWGFYHKVMPIALSHIAFLSDIDYTLDTTIVDVKLEAKLDGSFYLHLTPFAYKMKDYIVRGRAFFPPSKPPIHWEIELVKKEGNYLTDEAPKLLSHSSSISNKLDLLHTIKHFHSILSSNLL